MMQTLYTSLLIIHIAAGFTALASGLLALISQKGKTNHRWAGRVFYWCMLIVAISAIVMASIKWNPFLLSIGIFSFYQTYFGQRAIVNKSLKPNQLDWLILTLAGVNAGFMLSSGNVILMVFGVINAMLVVRGGVVFFKVVLGRAIHPKQWLLQHIGMMIGAYIATITAFLVVNIQLETYSWLVWLTPTFILSPMIAVYSRKFTQVKTQSAS